MFAQDGKQIFQTFTLPVSSIHRRRIPVSLRLDFESGRADIRIADDSATVSIAEAESKREFVPSCILGPIGILWKRLHFAYMDCVWSVMAGGGISLWMKAMEMMCMTVGALLSGRCRTQSGSLMMLFIGSRFTATILCRLPDLHFLLRGNRLSFTTAIRSLFMICSVTSRRGALTTVLPCLSVWACAFMMIRIAAFMLMN